MHSFIRSIILSRVLSFKVLEFICRRTSINQSINQSLRQSIHLINRFYRHGICFYFIIVVLVLVFNQVFVVFSLYYLPLPHQLPAPHDFHLSSSLSCQYFLLLLRGDLAVVVVRGQENLMKW